MIRLLLAYLMLTAVALGQNREAKFKRQRFKGKVPISRQVNNISTANSPLLEALFAKHKKKLGNVLANAEDYRVQIIFTQINRDQYNRPYVKHHTWRLKTNEYFFPASMVKMATSAMALEKLNRLKIEGLDTDTEMRVHGKFACQTGTAFDEMSRFHGYSCIRHCIKDIFLVSGNKSYDRLYEFVGQQDLNEGLWKKGYNSFQIVSRYGHFCNAPQNRVTNHFTFYQNKKIIYDQPMRENLKTFYNSMERTKVGSGIVYNGVLVNTPRDFRSSNTASLKDLHRVLMAIMLPQVVPRQSRFYLSRDNYKMLHKYMSMMPTESNDPRYDGYYTDTRMNYLLYGNYAQKQSGVRVFNKVGQAYGFLTDCAYIVDFDKGVEFLLSATIYCNEDGVLNDDRYDYYKYGFEFLKDLGEALLDLERKRRKPIRPRLDFYQHDYTGY